MNRVNWAAVVAIAILALIVVIFAAGFFGWRGYGGWGYNGWGMMGPGMMGGMFFMWLIPLGLLVLTVLGIVWLVQTLGNRGNPPPQTQACPSCGRNVQNDWKNCPYCGTSLGK